MIETFFNKFNNHLYVSITASSTRASLSCKSLVTFQECETGLLTVLRWRLVHVTIVILKVRLANEIPLLPPEQQCYIPIAFVSASLTFKIILKLVLNTLK
jgi:hypothetical protein